MALDHLLVYYKDLIARMVFRNIVPSHISALSLQQALELSNIYLENAYKTVDRDIELVLCHEAEVALSQAKSAIKKYPAHPNDVGHRALREGVAAAYIDLGKLLRRRGYQDEARTICKKAEKWGGSAYSRGRLAQFYGSSGTMQSIRGTLHSAGIYQNAGSAGPSLGQLQQRHKVVTIPTHIFAKDVPLPAIEFKLPEPDERLNNTRQLVCCLGLLQSTRSTDDILDTAVRKWLQAIEEDTDEQERLHAMATEIIRAFKRDEIKDAKTVAEVVCLAPVLNKDSFHGLLREFYSGIDHSGLLNFHHLEGLAQLLQGADPGHLNADDLVKTLELLSSRLNDTHQQSELHMHQLTLAVSHVLDAMADTRVTGLDRKRLHEPLSMYLRELKGSKDPYLVYQAAYAYQALLCVPDNETTWQAAMRRTGKVIQGVSGLVSAVKGLDLVKFIEGLEDIQKGVGVSKVVDVVKTAYDDVSSLFQSGQGFVKCLQEGLSFERKRDWYSALRGADTLILSGELATFRELVCEAPCRYDAAFQWGVCQRLGEIATNPTWDTSTRRSAIAFLGEIYRDDEMWGQQANVKQWTLNILMQLAASSKGALQLHATVAEALLQELESYGDSKKRDLYRVCRENGPIAYPLKARLPEFASPSLLDRVQKRPDVERILRRLRKQRTMERGNAVYIQPQAKESLQIEDDMRFPLMEKVKEFLESEQKVFLLLGDSGSGKTTFTRELEYELWQNYKSMTSRIPLYINLPAIDKPEHDMIAKQLRRVEFTEPQIREMKHYHKFTLICDGYDESQLTHNLYMSNQLNQPGEWDVQMVISCRREYLGDDYRDRFLPVDRNKRSDSTLFQEAAITPFSPDQVQAYIKQYVSVHQPSWQVSDYEDALNLIPSLKDLVKNPFLMTVSLEVLPLMVDPGQCLSTTRVTRVTLYDHFIEQWLERGKRRLAEKDLTPHARTAFECLSAEGFTQNGTEYLKKLAVAIYNEQNGQPVVEYTQVRDEASWKGDFFKEENKKILLEASPLVRNGNQHRFIHKSLLEYFLVRAVYDPQDGKKKNAKLIRSKEDDRSDLNTPLARRIFVKDHSILQLLVERVDREPGFKELLFGYIEYSRGNSEWSNAAANAITILVRAGVQFIGSDLTGIQIRGADLSHSVFDSVQLQKANLTDVNFRGAWLRKTDMSNACMEGVQFGELPLLEENSIVLSCDYSPDGTLLAVGFFEYSDIAIYKTSTWEKSLDLCGHTSAVACVVFSPRGDRLVSCSWDRTARLWDMAGHCQRILTGHTRDINHVAFSPQGDRVASASSDKTIRIWDSVSGECLQTLFGHSESAQCVTYALNGKQIASGSSDWTVRLWNVETGECSYILIGHSDKVFALACSPEGDQVASTGSDKTVRLWDAVTGACQHILTGHDVSIPCVAYSRSGIRITTGGLDGTVRLWDVKTGTCLHSLTAHADEVTGIVHLPKGNQITTFSADKTIRLWNVSVDESHFISAEDRSGVLDVKCSPKGDQIAIASCDIAIGLWDVETGTCHWTLRGHDHSVSSVAYSPQGDQIVSGSFDNSIRLWDMKTSTCLHTLMGHGGHIHRVAFSPQGDHVVSASQDTTIRVWKVATGVCCRTLEGHTDDVLSVAFSPNSKWIASGSKDCTVRLWDSESSHCQSILGAHDRSVWDVKFSPRGNQLASASDDSSVRLWNVETGDCQWILVGHTHGIRCIAYSPEGDLLATGSDDKTARLWDVESGESRAVIPSLQWAIRGIAWITTLDESYIITGCQDGSVSKWQVTKEDDQFGVRPKWTLMNDSLNVAGVSIENVKGLTRANEQLLKGRGAVGETSKWSLGGDSR